MKKQLETPDARRRHVAEQYQVRYRSVAMGSSIRAGRETSLSVGAEQM